MEKYILDTCTWIEYFRERYGVKERVNNMDVDQICASEITLAELTYGALNSGDYERHIKEPEWLRQYVTVYSISDVLYEYAQIRCALNRITPLLTPFFNSSITPQLAYSYTPSG